MRLVPALVPLLALGLAAPMNAQTLQSEMALDMRAVGEKYVSLAEAMPASAYAWRPAEGVRSVSEVFMHISAANMGLPASFMGVAPPRAMPRSGSGPLSRSRTRRRSWVTSVPPSSTWRRPWRGSPTSSCTRR